MKSPWFASKVYTIEPTKLHDSALADTNFIDITEEDLDDARDALFDKLAYDKQGVQGSSTKLNKETYKTIIEYVSSGCYISHAVAAAGVDLHTMYHWLKKAEKEPNTIYGAFSRELESAIGKAIIRNEMIIQTAGAAGDWKASAWWLAKMRPEIYGKDSKVKIELSGPGGMPIQIEDKKEVIYVSSDELKKMLDYEKFVDKVNEVPPPEKVIAELPMGIDVSKAVDVDATFVDDETEPEEMDTMDEGNE